MYLTESEVNVLLQEPLFSLPVTEFKQNYQLYQGNRKVTPRTIRFNLVPNFEPSIIQAYLQEKLTSYYRLVQNFQFLFNMIFCFVIIMQHQKRFTFGGQIPTKPHWKRMMILM